MHAAFTGFLEAALDAQRAGAPPPAIGPYDLIPARDQLMFAAVSLGIGMVYHVAFLRWKGATPGKLSCGLRVVPVDSGRSRGPLPWQAACIRSAIWVLPAINGFVRVFTVLDVLFPLWQPKRQAIHDLAAQTQVVRPGPEPGWPATPNRR